jgi:hypothetical protein
MTLRSKLIRLAHENPSLREGILPLLKDGAGLTKSAASAKAIVRFRKLEDHLKSKGDKDGVELLNDFADAMGI